jgi:UDP-glucuronate 4-epimerase
MDRPFDYLSTNVTGTLRLLDHCRIHSIPHFVFASSSSVYGPNTPLPAEETTIPDPCSPYALTKLQGEQWGRLYSHLRAVARTSDDSGDLKIGNLTPRRRKKGLFLKGL